MGSCPLTLPQLQQYIGSHSQESGIICYAKCSGFDLKLQTIQQTIFLSPPSSTSLHSPISYQHLGHSLGHHLYTTQDVDDTQEKPIDVFQKILYPLNTQHGLAQALEKEVGKNFLILPKTGNKNICYVTPLDIQETRVVTCSKILLRSPNEIVSREKKLLIRLVPQPQQAKKIQWAMHQFRVDIEKLKKSYTGLEKPYKSVFTSHETHGFLMAPPSQSLPSMLKNIRNKIGWVSQQLPYMLHQYLKGLQTLEKIESPLLHIIPENLRMRPKKNRPHAFTFFIQSPWHPHANLYTCIMEAKTRKIHTKTVFPFDALREHLHFGDIFSITKSLIKKRNFWEKNVKNSLPSHFSKARLFLLAKSIIDSINPHLLPTTKLETVCVAYAQNLVFPNLFAQQKHALFSQKIGFTASEWNHLEKSLQIKKYCVFEDLLLQKNISLESIHILIQLHQQFSPQDTPESRYLDIGQLDSNTLHDNLMASLLANTSDPFIPLEFCSNSPPETAQQALHLKTEVLKLLKNPSIRNNVDTLLEYVELYIQSLITINPLENLDFF